MINDLNIVNAALVYPEGIKMGHIGIKDGVISQVCEDIKMLNEAEKSMDAKEYLVFPGMIDTHVHIRGGDFSYREDFTSGSYGAVSSGITTILEMPGCAKPASTYERFLLRVQEVKKYGCINFGLYGGAGADNLEEIPKLARAGAVGFKTFHMAPVKGRETEFYGLCTEKYEDLLKVMSCIKKTGLTLTVHCESQQIINMMADKIQGEGRVGLKAFCDSRPVEAEVESVKVILKAAEMTGCRVIIAHVSTPEAAELVQQAKQKGLKVYLESCAHYLSFDVEEMEPYGVFARMKPPFRDRSRVERLAGMYADGLIDITGSDHAPYTKEEKLRSGNDIWNTFDGLCGLELTLPLLLKLVEENKLTYETIARNFSENAAGIFGLRQKGRIEAGKDADLVFVKKYSKKNKINIQNLFTKCKDSAVIYDNISIYHKIEKTMILGKFVYSDGAAKLDLGSANIVHPHFT